MGDDVCVYVYVRAYACGHGVYVCLCACGHCVCARVCLWACVFLFK